MRLVLVPLAVLALAPSARAAVSVAGCFGDHAVLQRDMPVPVWGWAAPDEAVSVRLGDEPPVAARAGADGAWLVRLPAHAAGGPFTLVVAGASGEPLRFSDVVIGEVWLCSGQSNMEFGVGGVVDFERERQAATDPLIRQMLVPRRQLSSPDPHLAAAWTPCSPDSVGGFTACGYFMARGLRKALDVPIGIIDSTWGGTRIEPWTNAAGFHAVPALKDIAGMLDALDPTNAAFREAFTTHLDHLDAWSAATRAALAAGRPIEPPPAIPPAIAPLTSRGDGQPTTLYNGMIHGLVGFAMRGATWYQGESNHGEGALYTEKMKALITGWRAAWGQGDFPFAYVQIAPHRYGDEDPEILARFWAAQAAVEAAMPNTAMVVINDVGDLNDIHPRNKQAVGQRLALVALHRAYGKGDVEDSGPTLRELVPEGATLRVRFAHATGLTTRDGKSPTWFEVIGEEGKWTAADARIDGDSIVLSAAGVAEPVGVRFAWSKLAEPNLVNAAGLPTGAFTAGGVAYKDPLPGIADAKGYAPVYELDLRKLGAAIAYDADHAGEVRAFDRVAYLIELQVDGEPLRWAWASMDAFTGDARKIGIPSLASGASFQQAVAHLVVASNAPGVRTGDLGDGWIEAWPNNYAPENTAHVPGARDDAFDWGDHPTDPVDGYGCLQIHAPAASQTIFAVNHWRDGAHADLGIGNAPTGAPDWTFAGNAGRYPVAKLRVFVRPTR